MSANLLTIDCNTFLLLIICGCLVATGELVRAAPGPLTLIDLSYFDRFLIITKQNSLVENYFNQQNNLAWNKHICCQAPVRVHSKSFEGVIIMLQLI